MSDAALRNAVLLRGSEILVEVKYATDFGPMGPVQGGIQPFAVPAFAFLYLLGHAEHQGYLSRLAWPSLADTHPQPASPIKSITAAVKRPTRSGTPTTIQ